MCTPEGADIEEEDFGAGVRETGVKHFKGEVAAFATGIVHRERGIESRPGRVLASTRLSITCRLAMRSRCSFICSFILVIWDWRK